MKVATEMLFSHALLPSGEAPLDVVIDPLMDGTTGEQSSATRSMGERIATLVREKYSRFKIEPFTRQTLVHGPLVLIGTFTAVNRDGKPVGARESYRICLALIDLRSGRIVGKGWSRAQMTGLDVSPTPFYRDSPSWTHDASVDGYIKTCQGSKLGDPIDAVYLDHILVAALIGEALDAYDGGRYAEALDTYSEARRMTHGADELRVLNGLYLSTLKLGHIAAALEYFGHIVDYGLSNKALAIKFLFRPGSTAFWRDSGISGLYGSWLRLIAQRSAGSDRCLEISGHTSSTGPASLNEHLSQLRAEAIQDRLTAISPTLSKRTIAVGMGSHENLVGTGRDDASDALDRRVAFKVIECGTDSAALAR